MLKEEPMQEDTQDMAAASQPVSRPQIDCEAVKAVLGDILHSTRRLREAQRDYNREMYALKRFLSQGPALPNYQDVLQQWMRLIDGATTALDEAQAMYYNTAELSLSWGFVSQSRRFLREKRMSAEERLCSKMEHQLQIQLPELPEMQVQLESLIEDLEKLFLQEAELGLNEDFLQSIPFSEVQMTNSLRCMELQRRQRLDPKLLLAQYRELVQELCTMRSELEVRKLKKSDYQNPGSGACFF